MPTKLIHHLLVAPLPYVPRSVIWKLSQRYIAGTDLDAAYGVVKVLNAANCSATIDVLGEDCTSIEQTETARDLYLEALDGIHDQSLNCNASVKLSEMGLRFDIDRCTDVMRTLLARAREKDNFIRIDMEDSTVTSATLDIYRNLRNEFDNVGTVIQSYLRRSEKDIAELLDTGPTNIRLCKGIYVEAEDIAFTNPDEIRRSFRELLEQLFAGGATKVGIATHDPKLVKFAEELIRRNKLDKERYEFQMLLGVAKTMRTRLVEKGHPLRVYVPFGLRWFDYSMRRLRENPQIAGHLVRNLFSRG
jgi:proline dehydrogenase